MIEVKDAKINRIIAWLMAVLLFFCFILFISGFIYSESRYKAEDCIDISTGWKDADGNPVSLESFSGGKDTVSVFYTIDEVKQTNGLIFAARNTYVDVYQDGNILLKASEVNETIFGVSAGTTWHFVSLIPGRKNSVIEFRCRLAYPNSHVFISDIYLGKVSSLYRNVACKNLPNFIFTIIWIVLSFALIFIYFIFKSYFKLERDLLYLATGALLCSTWCSVESRMWQFFFGKAEFVHLWSYLSIMLIPIPFGLLALRRLRETDKWKLYAQIYTIAVSISALLMGLLHVLKIVEFHYSLKMVHLFYVLCAPLITKVLLDYAKQQELKPFRKYLYVGYGLIVFFMLAGGVRYASGHYSDYAIYTKIALFIFYGIVLIYQMAGINTVFRKGLQAEFHKEMSMLDHLTKFYNRAGFSYHRKEYEKSELPVGIVNFDVNNLKPVNDVYGHEKGDELICLASSGIAQSFNSIGNCYRMGGDEFMVVFISDNPQEEFEKGLEALKLYCDSVNAEENKVYTLEIAYGCAIKRPDEEISDTMARADMEMYKKKREMKSK